MKRNLSVILSIAALVVAALSATEIAGAVRQVNSPTESGAPSVVSYQGQVTVSDTPYTGTGYFKFAVVNADGTISYWSNDGTSTVADEPTAAITLTISSGLFNVLLGDTSLNGMTESLDENAFAESSTYLRVWFSETGTTGTFEQLFPDQRIASVPYALRAKYAENLGPTGLLPGKLYSIYTVESEGAIGMTSSIIAGADGLPIISYFDHTNKDLKVAHCEDLNCSAVISSTLDSAGNTGKFSSIAIGVDGLGLISYRNITDQSLMTAHCQDMACTTAITSTLDTHGNTGKFTSITIGVDGLGLISYYDAMDANLVVAHCEDAACTTAITTTLDTGNDVGRYSSVTIGADGLGLISYFDYTDADLKVAHCENQSCTTATITSLATGSNQGYDTAITTGADGLGLISFYGNGNLRVAHCQNPACTSADINTIDSAGGETGWKTAITIGADGLGLISYFNAASNKLKVAHCSDLVCSSATAYGLTGAGSITDEESATSIALGVDGLGIISFYRNSSDDLVVVHCSNPFCMPNWRRR